MPLPNPHDKETEQEFVSRCIGLVVGDGTVDNTPAGRQQAAAMCYSQWADAQKKPKKDMRRAYSLLEIKSFDTEQRIISGIATTPQTDLMEDIVEPRGAVFNLPIPFLYQHDSKQPIGHVRKASVTDAGIEVEVKLVKVDEPGKLKDRLDEAWQSIKHGLVRGLSIGFKDLESEPIKDSWGSRIMKWSWLELSAVTIPANQAASITTIKQMAGNWMCGAARDLPIDMTGSWDGAAAQASMFNAGMDVAARGHLAHDASAKDLKGSYKLPFAMMENGKLTAMASGIRAAASRLPQTDIPAGVAASARSVLDHYEAKMKPKAAIGRPNMLTEIRAAAAAVEFAGDTATIRTPTESKGSIRLKGPKIMSRKSVSEQIADLEAKRAADEARRVEIQEKASDENRTKDDAEKEEFDTLSSEIKGIDAELVDLRMLEKSSIQQAKPVDGGTPQKASASRTGSHVISVKPNRPPAIGFARVALAKMASYKTQRPPEAMARELWPDDTEIEAYLKTAVAGGTTTTSGWASQLVVAQNLPSEFVEFLRPMTLIGRIAGFRRVPFNISIPRQTAGVAGQWVGEGKAKPLGKPTLDQITLRWAKAAVISVFTEELARFSNPAVEQLVRDDLAAGIAQFLDEQFCDPANTAVVNVHPGAITAGADTAAASGDTVDALIKDSLAAFANFQSVEIPISGIAILMQPSLAMQINMMRNALGQFMFPEVNQDGGTMFGCTVYTSTSVGSGRMIFLKPSEILLADDGGVSVDVSNQASLQMDDAPTAGAQSLVSLFQTNQIAVRAERWISWAIRRDDAVYYITSAAYGENGTA